MVQCMYLYDGNSIKNNFKNLLFFHVSTFLYEALVLFEIEFTLHMRLREQIWPFPHLKHACNKIAGTNHIFIKPIWYAYRWKAESLTLLMVLTIIFFMCWWWLYQLSRIRHENHGNLIKSKTKNFDFNVNEFFKYGKQKSPSILVLFGTAAMVGKSGSRFLLFFSTIF
jgi:hypothetical protein